MKFGGSRKSELWHRNVDATAGGQHPITEGPADNPNFPWNQLQLHTIFYLKKKRNMTPEQRDSCLTLLLQKHAAKDIAIAACAHAMSPQAVRNFLISGKIIEPNEYHQFLQTVYAAGKINPAAVEIEDGYFIPIIMAYLVSSKSIDGTFSRQLSILLTCLQRTPNTGFVLYPHLHNIIPKGIKDFAAELWKQKVENRWLRAYTMVGWLSEFHETPQAVFLKSLGPGVGLDVAFPDWPTWASWKPNLANIRMRDKLEQDQRTALQDFLALDGPDFTGSGKESQSEGLIFLASSLSWCRLRSGTLHIEPQIGTADEVRAMLARLGQAFNSACQSGAGDMSLFINICVSKVINDEALNLLEACSRIGDASISTPVLQIYNSRKELKGPQMPAIMRLLPVLGTPPGKALRDLLLPSMVTDISTTMETMQAMLLQQLQIGRPWTGMELNLQKFGKGIQDTVWLHEMLPDSLRSIISVWPTETCVRYLQNIRAASERHGCSVLRRLVDAYCMECLLKRGNITESNTNLIDSLVSLWKKSLGTVRQDIAIKIAGNTEIHMDTRRERISQLGLLPDSFINGLSKTMPDFAKISENDLCMSTIYFTDVLASIPSLSTCIDWKEVLYCWRPLLYDMIKRVDKFLIGPARILLKSQKWIQWLMQLVFVFSDTIVGNQDELPSVLALRLHQWVQGVSEYTQVLSRLEKDIGMQRVADYFLNTHAADRSQMIMIILFNMREVYDSIHQQAGIKVVSLLQRDFSNIEDIHSILNKLKDMTPAGLTSFQRIIELHQSQHQISRHLTVAVLASTLQDSALQQQDRPSLMALGNLLGIFLDDQNRPAAETLEAAVQYMETQVAELIAEAQRLDKVRKVLRRRDPKWTIKASKNLGIDDASQLESAIETLPKSIANVIEKVSDNEMEFRIPLNTLTTLQRSGIGAGNAQSLIVRLVLSEDVEIHGFCIHMDTDRSQPSFDTGEEEHKPWLLDKGAGRVQDVTFCYGVPNFGTYHLSRSLSRLPLKQMTLHEFYRHLAALLTSLGRSCMVCGTNQPQTSTAFFRPTLCSAKACSITLNRSSLDVRLTDIRHDQLVVDLLLTAVHAAAQSARGLALLPGCPIQNPTQVLTALSSIPGLSSLQSSPSLPASIQALGYEPQRLLSWVMRSYRGFLKTADGNLRISGMPALHQFLLAQSNPETESAWHNHARNGTTRVVFHGTTLDRLFSILVQGLKVCSGTALQAHGAAGGRGIYLAEDPNTSMSYASQWVLRQALGSGWARSRLGTFGVLLGCELAGSVPNQAVHIIQDATRVIVRYVFLMSPGGAGSRAAVEVDMLRVFKGLRDGNVGHGILKKPRPEQQSPSNQKNQTSI
jgi:hypothetical protein